MFGVQNDKYALVYSEVENPIYRALLDHVMLEMEWARNDKNLYSLCWGILSLPEVEKDDIRALQKLLQHELKEFKRAEDIRRFLTLEYILGLCLSAKALKDHKGAIPADLSKSILKLLEEAKNREWFRSHEFVCVVIYSISNVDAFTNIIADAYSWLERKFKSYKEDKDFEKIIDCMFGGLDREKWLDRSLVSAILDNRDKISSEGLSKLVIILLNSQWKKEASGLIEILEENLRQEFGGPLHPSLERGLREVISLSHSNCPTETIESILKALKAKGVPWADEITARGKEIVIKKLPELSRFPKIDPKAHALSFMALNTADRSVVYQLNKAELQKAQNAVAQTKRGYFGIRRAEYWAILLVTGMTSFFTFLFIVDIVTKISSTFVLSNVITALQEISQDWTRIFRYGHYGIIIYLWVYLIRILFVLRCGGEMKKGRLVGLMPLLGPIIKKLLGQGQ